MLSLCWVSLGSVLAFPVNVKGHAYLAKPTSKNAGDLTSFRLPHDEYYTRANWWVDKASFETPSETPWTQPGHFNFESARDLIPNFPQTFHPCGCYNPAGPQYCAGVELAADFGKTTLGSLPINGGEGPDIKPPAWPRGSEQETGFHLYANHGGGYLYMLCKKTKFDQCKSLHLPSPISGATRAEQDSYLKCVWDCFEENVLEFVPGSQRLQYQDQEDTYVTISSRNKSANTLPTGSLWQEIPIPDKAQVSGGGEGQCTWDAANEFSNADARTKFVEDFGNEDICDTSPNARKPRNWHVMDRVRIPNNLDKGEYLLSWRWDCYKADQLWSNCADVELVDFFSEETTTTTTTRAFDPTSTLVSTSAWITSTGATTSHTATQCSDGPLPTAWSGGGVHTCATYEQHGGKAYCAHQVLAEACCFCRQSAETRRLLSHFLA